MVSAVTDLEAVGHDVARHQAEAGCRRALCQGVRDGRRADDESLTALLADGLHEQVRDLSNPVVTAMGIGPGAGDGDDRVGLGGDVRVESGGSHFDAVFLPVVGAVLGHGGLSCGDGNSRR